MVCSKAIRNTTYICYVMYKCKYTLCNTKNIILSLLLRVDEIIHKKKRVVSFIVITNEVYVCILLQIERGDKNYFGAFITCTIASLRS